jgi:hypothetical protein
MLKFFKRNTGAMIALLLVFVLCAGAFAGRRQIWRAVKIGYAATSAGSILSAVTDTGSTQTITTGINKLVRHSRITATTGGTAADIAAGSVVLIGTDPNGATITETLPAFTENTATTVTSVKVYKTVSSIEIPQHDGTAATTSVEQGGAPNAAQNSSTMSALTDTGAQQTVTTGTSINALDVPRNITAFSSGTLADIGAIQVIITGTNVEDKSISETLPIFTANSSTSVAGSKVFKTVTQIEIPAHDGTGADTSIGTGDVLGIGYRLKRNTSLNTYLGNTVEGTGATDTIDADDIESNGIDLNSALNSTQVIHEFMETPF